ncbi:aminoglycoside phosphotransferase family protein [Streptomyces tropicalis]|uniref:Aminoglycoside phosphotransferase family protein n=1 Tax=Streptomyces tropicalis TaxID=3034234 RepID=A0ABT6AEM8_9ACTN|nr:aminoglycoside phosphotransferase family protein [Streptomyces tropicalis]MDF3303105.1 aminoglycoside phosphotransferase family protein [Streptomyces tropicalis]
MSGTRRMHADEAHTDEDLVRRLLRAQFPQWAELPVRRLASGGTVNAIYRLGAALTVRLPLLEGGSESVDQEARWLPRLAPLLPVAVPEAVALGEPGEGYPHRWAVHRWREGEVLTEGATAGAEDLARDLGAFVSALRTADPAGAPEAHRGGAPALMDAETRSSIEALRRTDEPFDADALLAAWERTLTVPAWSGPPCWTHADLMPSNLLGADARLAAVLDFGTAGVGDPAADLIPAWNLLPPAARGIFRDAAGLDDAAWERGRGRALSMAVVQLPYYRHTNPVISANARHVLHQVLESP